MAMKKVILSAVLLSTILTMTGTRAALKPSFSQQLLEQKKQLRPQEFNFFSDTYTQVNAKGKLNSPVLTFNEQLQQQRTQLRPQEFNFFSDRYKQVTAKNIVIEPFVVVSSLSFKDQLLIQKSQLRSQEFNFYSDRYKQVKARVK
jgi:hypothetical protein